MARALAVSPSSMFENLGYTYLGPVDGNDIASLEKTFKEAKKIKGPVLIHCKTIKGKGYSIAEKILINTIACQVLILIQEH